MIPFSSGALIKHPSAGLVLGKGPFTEQATPPSKGIAFYVNTFELNDPKPWKIPSEISYPSISDLGTNIPVHVNWQEPTPDSYAQVFEEIMQAIATGGINKCVPGMSEFGTLISPDNPQEIIGNVLQDFPNHFQYGYWDDKQGFCGATPEILVHTQDKHVSTMALAGTARPEDENVFINDQKEIREHEIVARSILSQLSPLGYATRTPRGILNLGSVIHFQTLLNLESEAIHSPDFWVHLLHPTPALGCEPKTEKNLTQLSNWRSQLRCPAHFGAPFGIIIDGEFTCLVAIRGFFWKEKTLGICAGGGVVDGSSLTHEWRELKLKRSTIKKRFHLG